jgi:acetyl-CoA carboxylase biotin carboxyl carrier protein
MSFVANRDLTYEDLVQLVELIKSTSQFSEFRLKVGEIEVSLRRNNGAVRLPPEIAPAAPVEEKSETRQRTFPSGMHLVRAPMVGTFFRAPAPGKPPYVEVGQEVKADTQVGIIEVMKLMNSIEAGARGVVKEIVVENAGAVEYGSVLMLIEPRK